ncbi:hypothetical protein BLNAU_8051 [Blattamonas nauphoetae]|uniref:Uncharacterized protein n=1 Tax=Blattamonas nauphoetae TaxID=2049346 RepID=A0ABQ9XZR8_9EUKA|nr:hypothetical protein BLNAU_8051 [Blattamonas nauphoetae]
MNLRVALNEPDTIVAPVVQPADPFIHPSSSSHTWIAGIARADSYFCFDTMTMLEEQNMNNGEQRESMMMLLRKVRKEELERTVEGRELKGGKGGWGGVVEDRMMLTATSDRSAPVTIEEEC